MPAWFEDLLPASLQPLLAEIFSLPVLVALGALSLLTFVASLIGVPYFLTRLPVDHFTRRERDLLGLTPPPRSAGRLVLVVLKNTLGMVLLVVGAAMLVLPGQGLLTLLVALLLLDFPGKRHFERWAIGHPRVLRAINALRKRAGKLPLEPRPSWVPPAFRQPDDS